MIIYEINNYVDQTTNFVCDSQATIDAGQADGWVGIFSVGGQTEADAILEANREAWMTANPDLFSVNKDTPVTEGTVWEACDLNTEPDNTDNIYQIFDIVNGNYQQATGLVDAKALYAQLQEQAEQYFVPNYIIRNDWKRLAPTQLSQGTQSL